jgi:two-component system, NarL family, invasion response regulator UvrY
MKTTIIVVDDHKLVREMWQELFARTNDIEVIGESGQFNEAIDLIKLKRPNIVLLDINLSHASGFDAVPLISKFSPGTKVIAVSMHSQPAYAKKMLQLGARGYVTKNSSREEMLTAIEAVKNGKKYICSEIKDIIADNLINGNVTEPGVKELSMRELEVIKYLKEGLSSKEIGIKMFISIRTVEVHRHNILKKLQIKNTAGLINYINQSNFST